MLLGDCAVSLEVKLGNTIVTTAATDRVDMAPSSGDLALAMRLRSLAVMTAPNLDSSNFQTSGDYTAIMFEHARFDDNDPKNADDEHLQWEPYVTAIFSNSNLEEVHVLDAVRGSDLNDSDLMTPSILLSRMREELRSQRYEEKENGETFEVGYRPIPRGPDLIEFDVAEFFGD